MLKILVAHNYYQQAGGEDTGFHSEIAMLRERGHSVIDYTDTNERINTMNMARVATNMIWSFPTQETLCALIQKISPDIVHFHNTFMMISPAAYYTCQSLGVPVIQTIQNYRLMCLNATLFRNNTICESCLSRTVPWTGVAHACYRQSRLQSLGVMTMLTTHRILKTWRKQVNLFITVTNFMRNKLIEGGLPESKIVVKPNFSDLPSTTKAELGDYALFVGRFTHEKGVLSLLRAWSNLKGIPLVMVGDGPLLAEIKQKVKEYNLEQIQIFGWKPRKEVVDLMKRARFLIQPSIWYEGFPMTIVESFACGLPVIASNLGSMAEVIQHQVTGLLFEPGNSDDLVAAVNWAWNNDDCVQEMGVQARAEYARKYTTEKNYELLTTIYQQVIDSTKSI